MSKHAKTIVGGGIGFLVGGPMGALVGAGLGAGMDASDAQFAAIEKAGEKQAKALEYEAQQLDLASGQATAAGQYGASEIRRQGKIVQSDLIAKVAASGGDVSDPSVQTIIGRNAQEINHAAMMQLYQAEDQARTLQARATEARMGVQSALGDSQAAGAATRTAGIANVLSSAGGLMARYWNPPTNTAAPFVYVPGGSYSPVGGSFSPVPQPFPQNYQPVL